MNLKIIRKKIAVGSYIGFPKNSFLKLFVLTNLFRQRGSKKYFLGAQNGSRSSESAPTQFFPRL